MTSEELLKRVRKIEIKTRGLSRNIFAGEYHSQFKGRGMAFAEVREYQPGDDVRTIDWNVTARLNKPYVKVFEEERELTVMLLIDVSGSRNFGTEVQTKRDLMAEVAATLAFSTIENNDKVGVLFFSDRVEKYIVDIVFATRQPEQYGLENLKPMIQFGGSPRASINLALAARAYAFIHRRGYVIPEDVRAVCYDVLRHRIGLTYEAEANNVTTEDVITEVLNAVQVP